MLGSGLCQEIGLCKGQALVKVMLQLDFDQGSILFRVVFSDGQCLLTVRFGWG